MSQIKCIMFILWQVTSLIPSKLWFWHSVLRLSTVLRLETFSSNKLFSNCFILFYSYLNHSVSQLKTDFLSAPSLPGHQCVECGCTWCHRCKIAACISWKLDLNVYIIGGSGNVLCVLQLTGHQCYWQWWLFKFEVLLFFLINLRFNSSFQMYVRHVQHNTCVVGCCIGPVYSNIANNCLALGR